MGYRAKQRILNWGIQNGWEAPEKMFNILNHQGNANQKKPKKTKNKKTKQTNKKPWDSTSHQSEWLGSKIQVTADAGKDVEKEEHSSTAGGIASLYNHSGSHSGAYSENWT